MLFGNLRTQPASKEQTMTEAMQPCCFCGMPCAANEYHPYAACLMFKACQNAETVRANLDDVRRAVPAHAQVGAVPLTDEQLAEMMRETWGCASIAPRHAMKFARAIANPNHLQRCPTGAPLWATYQAAGMPPHFTWLRKRQHRRTAP